MQKIHNLKMAFVGVLFLASLKPMFAQNINHWEMVVSASDTWYYFPGTSQPQAGWSTAAFDYLSWSSGIGGIGYGDNDDGTTIAGNLFSVFTRINFNLVDTSNISWAILQVDYDDAFVAYLNGHEIARANIGISGTATAYNTLALTDREAKMYEGGKPERFIIHKDNMKKYMVQGENILALQVHNKSQTSSDLSSNTFFIVGIKQPGSTYRQVPAWFDDPMKEKSNLPLLIINTNGQTIIDAEKITAGLKVVDNGYGQMNGLLDDATDYDGFAGIEIRGQSSQQFPKKGYGVELRNKAGADTSVSLLGMPAEADWVFSAPYSDKTMLRNAITYELGRKMAPAWQPRFKWCEVYLNEEYIGVYMLVEKIKRGADRVDINKLKPDEISGDNLTGGYILKVDKTWDLSSAEYFSTNPSNRYYNARNYAFTYVYPKYDEIVTQQKSYILNYLTTAENTLNGASFKDPANGFRKYMDMNSFIDFQVINEFANNVDGYRYSTFFYKKKDSDGGKLFAGPLWDFDLCYGNVDYSPTNLATDTWLYPHYGPNDGYPMHWWARLMEDEDYKQAFAKRWKTLREGPFSTDSIMDDIDRQTGYLGESVNRNFAKWPILGVKVWPNYFVGTTYTQEISYLKNWMTARLNWMDGNISLSIGELAEGYQGYQVNVFPNPVKNVLNLSFILADATKLKIEILDILGKPVYVSDYSPSNTGFQSVSRNLPVIPAGCYLLRLSQHNQVFSIRKLIIGN